MTSTGQGDDDVFGADDRAVLARVDEGNAWLRAVLCTVARRGTLVRHREPERAAPSGRVDPKGRHYYWATGTPPVQTGGELTDMEAWLQGFVTLTPLRIDRTEPAMLSRMRDWKLSLERGG